MTNKGHLSDYMLDRLRAGDLPHDREVKANEHLVRCAHCTERLDLFEREAKGGLQRESPEQFARRIAAMRTGGWTHGRSLVVRLATAASALVMIVILWLWLDSSEEKTGIRVKGAVELSFFVDHLGTGRPGVPGEVLREGDRIRLAVTPARHRYVFVLSVTDDGQLTPLYPQTWSQGIAVASTRRVLLEGSVILDDHLGDERIFALFSNEALDPQRVRSAASRAVDAARSAGRGVREMSRLPLSVAQDTVWFRKE